MDKKTEKINPEIQRLSEEISAIIWEIRQDPKKRSRELFQKIESYKSIEKNFHYTEMDSNQYKPIMPSYDKFCRAYLMRIFLVFIDEDDIELVLFLYGFLKEFDGITKDEQYNAYFNYARTHNPRINKKRKDKGSLLREVGKEIIQQLSETVAGIAHGSKDKLNFADAVYKEFLDNSIPEMLSLPITVDSKLKLMPQKHVINDERSLQSKIDESDCINCKIGQESSRQISIPYKTESSLANETYSEGNIAENQNVTDSVDMQPSSKNRSSTSQGSFEKYLIIILVMILGIVTIILALTIKEHSFEKETILVENNYKEDDNLEVKSIEIKNKYILLYPTTYKS